MDKIMNWLRSGKHRVIATIAVLLLLALSANAQAGNPTLKYKMTSGWMFQTDQGERFCRSEGKGVVTCLDANQNQYVCTYQDPPVYFKDCVDS